MDRERGPAGDQPLGDRRQRPADAQLEERPRRNQVRDRVADRPRLVGLRKGRQLRERGVALDHVVGLADRERRPGRLREPQRKHLDRTEARALERDHREVGCRDRPQPVAAPHRGQQRPVDADGAILDRPDTPAHRQVEQPQLARRDLASERARRGCGQAMAVAVHLGEPPGRPGQHLEQLQTVPRGHDVGEQLLDERRRLGRAGRHEDAVVVADQLAEHRRLGQAW
jgi:hypothetical protein